MSASIFSRVLRGYVGIFKAVAFVLALLGASAGLGFLVAYPLWFFATSSRFAYSIFTLAALSAGIAFLALRRTWRHHRGYTGEERRRKPLGTAGLVLLWIVLLAAGAYLVILLALRGMYVLAIPAAILLLAALGYIAYAVQAPKRLAGRREANTESYPGESGGTPGPAGEPGTHQPEKQP